MCIIIVSLITMVNNFSDNTGYHKNQPPIAPIPDKTRHEMKLYFGNPESNGLQIEERVIISSEQKAALIILEELIKGPRNKLLKSTLSPDTKILSVTTVDGICYVNLSKNFLAGISADSVNEVITIWSIVNSLTELDTVHGVQLFVEAQKIQSIEKYYSVKDTFYRNEDLIEKKIKTPFDTFSDFFQLSKGNQFEKAYQMLHESSKAKAKVDDFKLFMGNYVKELRDYEIFQYQTQKFSSYVVVVVTFKEINKPVIGKEHVVVEHWKMINENGIWKIVL